MSEAFPGTDDLLDTLAFRSATTAVLSFQGSRARSADPGSGLVHVRNWLGSALAAHPQKDKLIPRAMYFAGLMLGDGGGETGGVRYSAAPPLHPGYEDA